MCVSLPAKENRFQIDLRNANYHYSNKTQCTTWLTYFEYPNPVCVCLEYNNFNSVSGISIIAQHPPIHSHFFPFTQLHIKQQENTLHAHTPKHNQTQHMMTRFKRKRNKTHGRFASSLAHTTCRLKDYSKTVLNRNGQLAELSDAAELSWPKLRRTEPIGAAWWIVIPLFCSRVNGEIM